MKIKLNNFPLRSGLCFCAEACLHHEAFKGFMYYPGGKPRITLMCVCTFCVELLYVTVKIITLFTMKCVKMCTTHDRKIY